jgi:hypothetical protein
MTVILNAAYGRFATVAVLIAGSEAEHSSRVARIIGRPIEGGLNTVAACKSADQRDPFLGCHFGCGSRMCRKLEHCCFLIFKQVS